MIASHTLMATHLILFIHKDLLGLLNGKYCKQHIKGVQSHVVSTGISNIIGNKGAVGISFSLGDKSFLFINCHLAGNSQKLFIAGEEKLNRRNIDFLRILYQMPNTPWQNFESPQKTKKTIKNNSVLPQNTSTNEKKKKKEKVTNRFDHVFWEGDFNYRINSNLSAIKYMIKNEMYEVN